MAKTLEELEKIDRSSDMDKYLFSIASGDLRDIPTEPSSRAEEYLEFLAFNGGTGSGDLSAADRDKINKVPVLEQKVNQNTSQLDDITIQAEHFGVNGNGIFDNTSILQKLIDRKGKISLTDPGVFVTSTLKIGDDTTLILGSNTELKLKDGTSNHLLENKKIYATDGSKNYNISVIGGILNYNRTNNPPTGAYLDGKWSAIGCCFNNVQGLKIKSIVKAGNADKYAFLFSNIINGEFEGINIENGSDGLHFQAPCKNIKINNCTGYTHDNYIAFTIGDYRAYTISEDGNFENIEIDNINLSKTETTLEVVRFVGAGKSDTGVIRNIKISNISGKMRDKFLISILGSDQSMANDYLKSTNIENLEISNIDWDLTDFTILLYANKKTNIKNLKINNIATSGINAISARLLQISTDTNVQNVSLDSLNLSIPTGLSELVWCEGLSPDICNITNSKLNIPSKILNIYSPSGLVGDKTFNIDKCKIITGELVSTTDKITVNVSNSTISTTSNIFNLNGLGLLNYNSINNNYLTPSKCGVTSNKVGNLFITGTDFPFVKGISDVGAKKGSCFINGNNLNYHNGDGWFSLTTPTSGIIDSTPAYGFIQPYSILWWKTPRADSYIGIVEVAGGSIACNKVWQQSIPISTGQRVYTSLGDVYEPNVSGTIGTVEPTGATFIDGSITWTKIGKRCVFKNFGKIDA